MDSLTVLQLLRLDGNLSDSLHLTCIAGKKGLSRKITASKISRPGLPLSGYFKDFSEQSIQVFGRGEQTYLQDLVKVGKIDSIDKILSYNFPCCIFSGGGTPPSHFLKVAENYDCPILQSQLISSDLSRLLYQILDEEFAPTVTIHGVLVEVFGMGVLLTGESGVGKSETALELLDRGHRLISDDTVKIRNINDTFLVGGGENKQLSHHMEIRGLGIINIPDLYGISSIRERKEIQFWAHLEDWDQNKNYERISEEKSESILGIKIPKVIIPVKPGRNIPIIIETAAKCRRLEQLGYQGAKHLDSQLMDFLETKL